jgi:hypothetical protein
VIPYNNYSFQWGKDLAKERILKDVMLTFTKAANQPNKKKAAPRKNVPVKGVQTSLSA